MKKLFLAVGFILIGLLAFTQSKISGTVLDKNQSTVVGATVQILDSYYHSFTDKNGGFEFDNIPNGIYQIKISYLGYQDLEQKVNVDGADQQLEFVLSEKIYGIQPVAIEVRVNPEHKGSFTDLQEEDLEELNYGQDMPYLLKMTPSVVISSDAGTGIGYTSMRLRGSDQTRINVTINGVPLNDSESHNVFWVDLPDFASSADNVQIQRGVGSSTNGAGAFGGSVNIETQKSILSPRASFSSSVGSYETFKNTMEFSTGRLGKHWNFEGRKSNISSSGFIDRGSADLESFYFSGTYFDSKFSLQAIVMTGHERTYQAWWGIPEAKLFGNEEGLQTHINNNNYTSEEIDNLLNADNRTYNYYEYEDQVDNYGQDHYQLIFSKSIQPNLHLKTVFHYTYGAGFYEEFKTDQDFVDYGLNPMMIGGDTINSTELVRQRWLDNHFYGLTWSLKYDKNIHSIVFGGAANQYDGLHYGELKWLEFASNANPNQRYYRNNSFKQDANAFVKLSSKFDSGLISTVDLQYRFITYEGAGFDNDRTSINIDEQFGFFNPKILLTYPVNNKSQVYANAGVANKEPVRSDFIDSDANNQPKSENLLDIELGYERAGVNHLLNLNFYYMAYKDQLVLTGAVNDVGAPIRTNVDQSYRMGLEIIYGYQFDKKFNVSGNVALSQNKIGSFESILIDYENEELLSETKENTDISFSPELVVSNQLQFNANEDLSINLLSKYVGQQFLDNTSSDKRLLDAFLVNDLVINYQFKRMKYGDLSLGFQINNILDEEYETFGYTYSYIYGDLITENFYYPQAGRNVMIKLRLDIFDKKDS